MRPLRPVGRDVVRRLRGHDVALYAAGLTFYGGIAVLPTGLLALWVAGLVLGADRVARLGASLADALPGAVGAPETVRAVVDAGASLGWVTALVALVPASLYGEGLRRRVRPARRGGRVARRPSRSPRRAPAARRHAAARGRGPPVRAVLRRPGRRRGRARAALAAYLALCLGWVLLTGPMAYVYRVLSPRTPSRRAALLAGTTAAAFVAGFLQGFVLFLAIPLDLGRPFGGFGAVGACVAVALWLMVLHLVVLLGYALSRTLDAPVADGRRAVRPGWCCAGRRPPGRSPR